MVEGEIVGALLNGGLGACSGVLAAYFYLRGKLALLENEIKSVKQAREDEGKELDALNKKIDKLLEYMPILRLVERNLRFQAMGKNDEED